MRAAVHSTGACMQGGYTTQVQQQAVGSHQQACAFVLFSTYSSFIDAVWIHDEDDPQQSSKAQLQQKQANFCCATSPHMLHRRAVALGQ